MYWNPEVLTRIDAADDLKIAPYHPDMNTTGTPTWIWEVKVDNRLFVRAYSGIRSKFLIITSVADQARLIHTAGGALSNEHFIWHPVTRSVRKCNSSKICRTVQAAGVAE